MDKGPHPSTKQRSDLSNTLVVVQVGTVNGFVFVVYVLKMVGLMVLVNVLKTTELCCCVQCGEKGLVCCSHCGCNMKPQ